MDKIQLLAFAAAIMLAFVFCLCLGLSGGDENTANEKITLDSLINPNNASAASLARLPGVGLTRAQAIISYREQFRQNHTGDLAFNNCNDLDNVKGIGPVTVSNICEHLKFK